LAKLASDKAKNTGGIYTIGTMKIKREMENTRIEEIWGIGKNTTNKLHRLGILKCSEFLALSDSFIKANFGANGLELKHELSGEVVSPVNTDYKAPKSIQDTSAFPLFSDDKTFIKKELSKHIHIACKKLRKHNGYCLEVGVMLRTKDFKVYYDKKKLDYPLNFELEILKIAFELLDKIFIPDVIYRATGICLNNLTCTNFVQVGLFDEETHKNENESLAKTIDNLEQKYGKKIVRMGY